MGLPKRRYAAHTCISISGTNTKYWVLTTALKQVQFKCCRLWQCGSRRFEHHSVFIFHFHRLDDCL